MTSQGESNVYLQSLHLVERFAKYLSKEADPENSDMLKDLVPYFSHFCSAIKYNNAAKTIFDSYVAKIDSSLTEVDCNQILSDFNNEISDIQKDVLLQNCEKYQELVKLYSVQNNQNDDDVVAVSQNLNNIDPITKLPIIEPVKNVKCGHVYEKTSILSLIKRNPKTKCPIMGCVTSGWVQANDLVSNYTF